MTILPLWPNQEARQVATYGSLLSNETFKRNTHFFTAHLEVIHLTTRNIIVPEGTIIK